MTSEVNYTERQSNIELLRILSMLMVIGLHINFVSLGKPTEQSLTTNFSGECLRIILENICLVSVNVFVLISGFFGIRLRKEKIIKYLFMVFFFATFVMIIAILLWGEHITIKDGLKFYYSYLSFNWFVGGYFALMLLSPLINSFVENNSVKRLATMVALFFVVDSVLGYLLPNVQGIGSLNGYSIIHLLFIYILGRLIYQFRDQLNRYSSIVYLVLFGAYVIINTTFSLLFFSSSIIQWWNPIVYNNPFVIIGAVALFLIFYKIPMKTNKPINMLATSAFSVFLVHANTLFYPHFIQINTTIYDNYSGLMTFCIFVGLTVGLYLSVFLIYLIQIKCSSFFLKTCDYGKL